MTDMSTTLPAPPTRQQPTEYRIRARADASGQAMLEAATRPIPLDASWGGARSGLAGPAELLASAFAACLLKNLARSRHLLRFDYEEADVEVQARRQDSPPKFVEISYIVRVITDEPQRRVDLAHYNLRKFGTVYNTLAAVYDVHGIMEAIPRACAPDPR